MSTSGNGPTNDSENESENDHDVVIERRIDRRLRELETGDRPWLRRFVGAFIILASVYFGWEMMGSRVDQVQEEVTRLKVQIPAPTPAPKPSVGLAESQTKNSEPGLSDLATGGALTGRARTATGRRITGKHP